jgi:hypothetical protein
MDKVTKKSRIVKSRWHSNTKKWNVRKRQRSRVRSNNKTKRVYTGGRFSLRKRVVTTSDVGKSSGWDCTCRFAENSPEVSVSNTGPDVRSETITPLPTARASAAASAAASVAAAVAAAATSMRIPPQSSPRPSPPKGHPPRDRPNRKHTQNPPEISPESESDILKRLQLSVQGGGAPPEEITKNVICECKKRPVVV